MSSAGTGSPISAQEAMDLLHKLITESTRVQAAFAGGAGVNLSISGKVKVAPDGRFCVVHGDELTTSTLFFDPSRAVDRRYGDDRAFPRVDIPNAPRFKSALVFVMPDTSQLALFEFA